MEEGEPVKDEVVVEKFENAEDVEGNDMSSRSSCAREERGASGRKRGEGSEGESRDEHLALLLPPSLVEPHLPATPTPTDQATLVQETDSLLSRSI